MFIWCQRLLHLAFVTNVSIYIVVVPISLVWLNYMLFFHDNVANAQYRPYNSILLNLLCFLRFPLLLQPWQNKPSLFSERVVLWVFATGGRHRQLSINLAMIHQSGDANLARSINLAMLIWPQSPTIANLKEIHRSGDANLTIWQANLVLANPGNGKPNPATHNQAQNWQREIDTPSIRSSFFFLILQKEIHTGAVSLLRVWVWFEALVRALGLGSYSYVWQHTKRKRFKCIYRRDVNQRHIPMLGLLENRSALKKPAFQFSFCKLRASVCLEMEAFTALGRLVSYVAACHLHAHSRVHISVGMFRVDERESGTTPILIMRSQCKGWNQNVVKGLALVPWS